MQRQEQCRHRCLMGRPGRIGDAQGCRRSALAARPTQGLPGIPVRSFSFFVGDAADASLSEHPHETASLTSRRRRCHRRSSEVKRIRSGARSTPAPRRAGASRAAEAKPLLVCGGDRGLRSAPRGDARKRGLHRRVCRCSRGRAPNFKTRLTDHARPHGSDLAFDLSIIASLVRQPIAAPCPRRKNRPWDAAALLEANRMFNCLRQRVMLICAGGFRGESRPSSGPWQPTQHPHLGPWIAAGEQELASVLAD